MGFQRHFLKQDNFILSKASGELNDQDLMQQVVSLNRETEGVSDFRELSDCRDLKSLEKLTVHGTTQCAQAEENRSESLLAILIADSNLHFGMARAYQMLAEENRKAVKIFTDLHEALAWLAKDSQEIEVLKNFVNNA
ncbi:MAG: hypothetical protein GY855_00635 [candidate division Zixibacteria bacterium]|nr:hypothetical protein [candidate division Zixibacteria bacterium]